MAVTRFTKVMAMTPWHTLAILEVLQKKNFPQKKMNKKEDKHFIALNQGRTAARTRERRFFLQSCIHKNVTSYSHSNANAKKKLFMKKKLGQHCSLFKARQCNWLRY